MQSLKKPLLILGVFAAMWLVVRYLLPAVFPFVLGAMLAVASEPLVQLVHRKMHFPRAAAVGIGVSSMLLLVFGILSILGALLVKEVSQLTAALPKIADTARQGVVLLEDWLVSTAQQAPEELRVPLTNTVLEFFNDGTALMQSAAQRVPAALTALPPQFPISG